MKTYVRWCVALFVGCAGGGAVRADLGVRWYTQFGSSGFDAATGIAVDGAGQLWVGGFTTGKMGAAQQGSEDLVMAHLSPAGTVQSIDQENGDPNTGLDSANGVAVTTQGVYVSGQFGLYHYDTAGVLQDRTAERLNVLSGSPNTLLVTGTDYGFIPIRPFVSVRDDRGKEAWSDAVVSPAAGAVDSAGNSYVIDLDATAQVPTLLRYDDQGHRTLTVTRPTRDPNAGFTAMAADGAGNIYLAGRVRTGLGPSDALLTKLDPEGHVLWTRVFGETSTDGIHAMALDGEGRIWVGGQWLAGEIGTVASVGEFDADGNLLSELGLTRAGVPEVRGVAVGPQGQVYVAGDTTAFRANGGVSDMFVAEIAVPEPAALLVMGIGLAGLVFRRRERVPR